MTEQAVSLLDSHPWVDKAWWDPDRTAIMVRPAAEAVAVRPRPGPLLLEQLDHWRHVYEYVYSVAADRHGDDLDLSGWRASDTGRPFPRAHMIEWIDHAVGLVLRGKPDVVLELGCGSGLIAHRVHRKVRAYVGLDVAEPAVARLRDQALPGVRVLHGAAHDVASEEVAQALRAATGSPSAVPDCIVLNSVTPCFPNERYLTAVLDDALDLVAPGGRVIVGDVRNLATAPSFARWLESARNPGIPEPELARRAADRIAAEEELLCDPRVFAGIARRHTRNVQVTCYAKPLQADTELTRYRYDVVYTVDAPVPPPVHTIAWADLSGTVAERLATVTGAGNVTLITDIPNALLDGGIPDAVTPAELAAAIPPSWAVLLDSPDGRLLAVGPPEHQVGRAAVSDTHPPVVCNDPFARFVRRRLPEMLADHLERHAPATALPDIVVAEEPIIP
ncbi:class I SAM-dependent methyltransferase [Nocardia sp. Marseille-Q1738]